MDPSPSGTDPALGRDLDVVVVGAGVVGLSAALALQATGRRVAIVTADAVSDTTSHVAAAVWFPTEVGPQDRVAVWGRHTFEVLSATARDHPAAGVLLRDTVMLYREPPGRPWWAAAVDGVRDARPEQLPPGYAHGLAFSVPLVEMPVHLAWLVARFTAAGGRLHRARLTSLRDLAGVAPVLVHCSGLGARDLVGDTSVVPVRGQVVRTTNPGLTVSLRDQHHPDGYTYVHPRTDDVVLGGTLEVGRSDLVPDPDVTAAILARCTALAPALADAEVIGAAVGLRPGRPTVRLEVDERTVPGTVVVHDYGHGGAGVTLAWGCAAEVVRLVEART
ncbi:FAD-dependent oxidoreductase [Nitriliruptor alkaliphilus]|uniref:FAD-dependent oxidoreductase n=1 Tax=Nitriliruptor alkaliphilus TaxID=427918 RepID=UPI0006970BBA|nr:FAD-dependent oxidoreductase [Nitriliruptor alkaliphilus]